MFFVVVLVRGFSLESATPQWVLNHIETTDQYKCSCYVIQPKTKHYAQLWCFYHKIQHLYQRHCISRSFITTPSATYGFLNGVLVSLYTPQTWVERDNTEQSFFYGNNAETKILLYWLQQCYLFILIAIAVIFVAIFAVLQAFHNPSEMLGGLDVTCALHELVKHRTVQRYTTQLAIT